MNNKKWTTYPYANLPQSPLLVFLKIKPKISRKKGNSALKTLRRGRDSHGTVCTVARSNTLSGIRPFFHVRNTPQPDCSRKTAAKFKPRDRLNFEKRHEVEKWKSYIHWNFRKDIRKCQTAKRKILNLLYKSNAIKIFRIFSPIASRRFFPRLYALSLR